MIQGSSLGAAFGEGGRGRSEPAALQDGCRAPRRMPPRRPRGGSCGAHLNRQALRALSRHCSDAYVFFFCCCEKRSEPFQNTKIRRSLEESEPGRGRRAGIPKRSRQTRSDSRGEALRRMKVDTIDTHKHIKHWGVHARTRLPAAVAPHGRRAGPAVRGHLQRLGLAGPTK